MQCTILQYHIVHCAVLRKFYVENVKEEVTGRFGNITIDDELESVEDELESVE